MRVNKRKIIAYGIAGIATTLLVAPFVVSCAKSTQSNSEISNPKPLDPPHTNPPNNNTDKPNNNTDKPNNNADKPPEPNVPSTPGKKPNNGTLHGISLSTIEKATSPLSIIAESKLFKDAVNNMYASLNGYDWKDNGNNYQVDFVYDVGNSKINSNFYKLNQEVGIAGEYTYTKDTSALSERERLNQLMQCMPSLIDIVQYDMTQKYLDNFTNQEASGAIDKTSSVDLNHIIEINQFGYLPSNLSQLLYYMDYEGIASILGLTTQGVKDIKANYEDGALENGSTNRKQAYIKLLVTDDSNNKYIYNITLANTPSLKCDYDFVKYVYDRTFLINWPKSYRTTIEHPQTSTRDTYVNIKAELSQGTCFVIDRVDNPALEAEGKYQFLVGSNAHVLDVSKSFNKSRSECGYNLWKPNEDLSGISNKTYAKYWDGGWRTEKYAGSDVPSDVAEQERIVTVNGTAEYSKHSVIENRKPNYNYGATISAGNNANPDKVDNKKPSSPTSITNKNFIDTIWYTPELTTKGSWTLNELNSKVGPVFDPINKNDLTEHEQQLGRWTGTISNAGGDFAITKMTLDKKTIQSILPTLYDVLGTNKEKDWYVGLSAVNGKSTMPSANSTLFGGGYPSSEWKSIKSIGGKIVTQKRFLDVNAQAEGNVVHFWEKYNKADNERFNAYRGLVEWYDNYQNFQFPSMSPEDNKIFNPHGMEIQKIVQQSLISFSNMLGHKENDVLQPGSSGSLIINSRFEPVAVNCVVGNEVDNPNSWYNYGMMFSNYTKDNKSFTVQKQVMDKLAKEGTYTLKMRPR